MTITLRQLIGLLTDAGGWVPESAPSEALRISLKAPVGTVRVEQYHSNNAEDNVVELLVDESDSLCAIDLH